jgi:hypothetical protein
MTGLAAGIVDFMSAGLSVGDRVYPLALPQDVDLPALAYRIVSDVPVISHSSQQDHVTYSGTRYSVTRVQFDCYALTYDEAEALADELLAYAAGYRGLWGSVEVDRVDPDIRTDDWDEAPRLYRVIQDIFVGHRVQPS